MWIRPTSRKSDALSSKPHQRRSEGGSKSGSTALPERDDTDYRRRPSSDRSKQNPFYDPNYRKTTEERPRAEDDYEKRRVIESRRNRSPEGLRKKDRQNRSDSTERTSTTRKNRRRSFDQIIIQQGRAVMSDDAPTQSGRPSQADLSVRVPNQFPNQTPLDFALPYRPPMRRIGSAAEYYGDHGESVAQQPGIRPVTPIVTGAEPHLMATLQNAEPPHGTQLGSASEFHTSADCSSAMSIPATPGIIGKPANVQFAPDLSDPVSLSPLRPPLARPPSSKPASHPFQSNAPVFGAAAMAVGAAELSTVNSKQYLKNPPWNLDAQSEISHRPSTSNVHSQSPYALGELRARHHQHRGPVGRLVDWWKNYEDVRKMEEYTEYIGVCRYCFDPQSSARDGPREHHPRKRNSREFRNTKRVDKDNRYSTSDNERREKRNASWINGGLAGYSIAKATESLKQRSVAFGAYRAHDGGYAARGRHSSEERRSAFSLGTVGHGKGSDSDPSEKQGAPREARKQFDILDRSGRIRSRSRSRDKGTVLLGLGATAAAGMIKRRSASHSHDQRLSDQEPRMPRPFDNVQREENQSLSTTKSLSVRGPRLSSQERRLQSSVHFHDSSSETDSTADFFKKFFSRSGGRKRGSGTKKPDGPYISANPSSISSMTNLAYGQKSIGPKSTTLKKREMAGRPSARDALLGLGAAAAVLATADPHRNKRRNRHADLVAINEQRGKPLNGANLSSRRLAGGSTASSDAWESATEDGDESSVSSGLAFGDYDLGNNLSARKSTESLSSASSANGKWGWRWGKKKDRKLNSSPRSKYAHVGNAPQPSANPFTVSVPGSLDARNVSMSQVKITAPSSVPLQYIEPMPTSEPIDYDFRTRINDRPLASRPIIGSPTEDVLLHQPQPRSPRKGSYAIKSRHGPASNVDGDEFTHFFGPTKASHSRSKTLSTNMLLTSPTLAARDANLTSQDWNAGRSRVRPFPIRGESAPVTGTMARKVSIAGGVLGATTGAAIEGKFRPDAHDPPSSEGFEVSDGYTANAHAHQPKLKRLSWSDPKDESPRRRLGMDVNTIEVDTDHGSEDDSSTAKTSTIRAANATHVHEHGSVLAENGSKCTDNSDSHTGPEIGVSGNPVNDHPEIHAVEAGIPADQSFVQHDIGASIHPERHYEVRQQRHRAHSDPIYDDELYDPDLFKKPRQLSEHKLAVLDQTALEIFADLEQRYKKEPTTMAAFFAPPEISLASATIDARSDSAHAARRKNDTTEHTEEQFSSPPTAKARFVPTLNVIAPTPPGSTVGSNKGGWSRDFSPTRSPIDANVSTPAFASTDTVPRASWAQPETEVCEVETPEEQHEEVSYAKDYGSHSKTRPYDSTMIVETLSDHEAEPPVHIMSNENPNVPRAVWHTLPESGDSTVDSTKQSQLVDQPSNHNECQQSFCGSSVADTVSAYGLGIDTPTPNVLPPTTAFVEGEVSEDSHVDPQGPLPSGDNRGHMVMNMNLAETSKSERGSNKESYGLRSLEGGVTHDESEINLIESSSKGNEDKRKEEYEERDTEVSQLWKTPPRVSSPRNSRVYTEVAMGDAQNTGGHDTQQNEYNAESLEPVVERSFSQKGSDVLQRGMASVVAVAVMAGTAFGTQSIQEDAAEELPVSVAQEPNTEKTSERKLRIMPGGFDSDEEFGDSKPNENSNNDPEERSSRTVGKDAATAQMAVIDAAQLPSLFSKGNDELLSDEHSSPALKEKEAEEATLDNFEVSKKSKFKKSKLHAASSMGQANTPSTDIEGWAITNNKKSKKSKKQTPRYPSWTPEPDEHEMNATDRPQTAVRDDESTDAFNPTTEVGLGDEVAMDRSTEPSGIQSKVRRSRRRENSPGAALDLKKSALPSDKANQIENPLLDSETRRSSDPKKSWLERHNSEQEILPQANKAEEGESFGQLNQGLSHHSEPNEKVEDMAPGLTFEGFGPIEKRRKKKSKRRTITEDTSDIETTSTQLGSRSESGPMMEKTMVEVNEEWAEATSRRSRKSDPGMSSQVKATKVDTSSPRWTHFEVDEQRLTGFEDPSHANDQDVVGHRGLVDTAQTGKSAVLEYVSQDEDFAPSTEVAPETSYELDPANPPSLSSPLLNTLHPKPMESRSVDSNEFIPARLSLLSSPRNETHHSEFVQQYENACSPSEIPSVSRKIAAAPLSHPRDIDVLPESVPLPESSPSSPHMAGIQTGQAAQHAQSPPLRARSPSSTAVPLRFRRPPQSPGLPRDSPVASPSIVGPSSPSTARVRSSRPTSTEFKSSTEFLPLYLVERNRKVREPEAALPSLPSSRTTSRSSSVLDSEEAYESAPESQGNSPGQHPLSIETGYHGSTENVDYSDSQQTTPKAGLFPSGMSDALDGLNVARHEEVSDDPTQTLNVPRGSLPVLSTSSQASSRLVDDNLSQRQCSSEPLRNEAGSESRDTRSTASESGTTYSATDRPLTFLSNMSLGAVATTAALFTAAVASPILIAGAVLHKDDKQVSEHGPHREEIKPESTQKSLDTAVTSRDNLKPSEDLFTAPQMTKTPLGEITPRELENTNLYQENGDRVSLEEATVENRSVIEEESAPELTTTVENNPLPSTQLLSSEEHKKGKNGQKAASEPNETESNKLNTSFENEETALHATPSKDQGQVSEPKVSAEHNSWFFSTLLRRMQGKNGDWEKEARKEAELRGGLNAQGNMPPFGGAEWTSGSLVQQENPVETKEGDGDDLRLSTTLSRKTQGRKDEEEEKSALGQAQTFSPTRRKSLSLESGNDKAFLTEKTDELFSVVGESQAIDLNNITNEELPNGTFDAVERSPASQYISSKAGTSHLTSDVATQVPLPESHDSDLEEGPSYAEQPRLQSSTYIDILSAPPDPALIPLPECSDEDLITVSKGTESDEIYSVDSSGSKITRSNQKASIDADLESNVPVPKSLPDSADNGSGDDLLLQQTDVSVMKRKEHDLHDFARLLPLPDDSDNESDSNSVPDNLNAINESLLLPLGVDTEANETLEESLDRGAINGPAQHESREMPRSFPSPGRFDTTLRVEPKRTSSSTLPEFVPLPGGSDGDLEVSVNRYISDSGLEVIDKSEEVFEDEEIAALQHSLPSLQSAPLRHEAERNSESKAPSEEHNTWDFSSIAVQPVESTMDLPDPQPNEPQKELQDELWSFTSKKKDKKAKGRKSAQQNSTLEASIGGVPTNSRGQSEVDTQAAAPGVDDLAITTKFKELKGKKQNRELTSDVPLDDSPRQTEFQEDGINSQPSLTSPAAEDDWFTTPKMKGKKGKNQKRLRGDAGPTRSNNRNDVGLLQPMNTTATKTHSKIHSEQSLLGASTPKVKSPPCEQEGSVLGNYDQKQEVASREPSFLVKQFADSHDSKDACAGYVEESNEPLIGKVVSSSEDGIPNPQKSFKDVEPLKQPFNDNTSVTSTLEREAKLARTDEEAIQVERNDFVEDEFPAVSKAIRKKTGKDKRRALVVHLGESASLSSGPSTFGDTAKGESATASKPSKNDTTNRNDDQVQGELLPPAIEDGEPKALGDVGDGWNGGNVPEDMSLENTNFAPKDVSQETDAVQTLDTVPPVNENFADVQPFVRFERDLPVEDIKLSRHMTPTADEDQEGKNEWSSARLKQKNDKELQQDVKLPLDVSEFRTKSDNDTTQKLNAAETGRPEAIDTRIEKVGEEVEIELGSRAVPPRIIEVGSFKSGEPEATTDETWRDTKAASFDAGQRTITSNLPHSQSIYNESEYQAQQNKSMVAPEAIQGSIPEESEFPGVKREQLLFPREDDVPAQSSLPNDRESQREQEDSANTSANTPDHPAASSIVATLSGAIAGGVGMLFGSSFVKFNQGKKNTEEARKVQTSGETPSELPDMETTQLPEKQVEIPQEHTLELSLQAEDDLIDRILAPSSKKLKRDKKKTKKANNVDPVKGDLLGKLENANAAETEAEYLRDDDATKLQQTGDKPLLRGPASDVDFLRALVTKSSKRENRKTKKSEKSENADDGSFKSTISGNSRRPESVEEDNDRHQSELESVLQSEQSNSTLPGSFPKSKKTVLRNDVISTAFEPLSMGEHTAYAHDASKDDNIKHDETVNKQFTNKENKNQSASPRYAVVEAPATSPPADEPLKSRWRGRTSSLQPLTASEEAQALQDSTARAVIIPLRDEDNGFDIEHGALTGLPAFEYNDFKARPSSPHHVQTPDHSLMPVTTADLEHSLIQAAPVPTPSRDIKKESSSSFDDGGDPAHSPENNDFAAILAAGLEDTGFDPNLVMTNPNYHQTNSPPDSTLAAEPDDFYTLASKPAKKAQNPNTQQSETFESQPLDMIRASNGEDITNRKHLKDDTFDDIVSASLGNAGYDPLKFRIDHTGDRLEQESSLAVNGPDFGLARASFNQGNNNSKLSSAIRPSEAWRSSPSPPRTPAPLFAQDVFAMDNTGENSDSQLGSAPSGDIFAQRVSKNHSTNRQASVTATEASVSTGALEIARLLESTTPPQALEKGSKSRTPDAYVTIWNADHVGNTQDLRATHTLSKDRNIEEYPLERGECGITAAAIQYHSDSASAPTERQVADDDRTSLLSNGDSAGRVSPFPLYAENTFSSSTARDSRYHDGSPVAPAHQSFEDGCRVPSVEDGSFSDRALPFLAPPIVMPSLRDGSTMSYTIPADSPTPWHTPLLFDASTKDPTSHLLHSTPVPRTSYVQPTVGPTAAARTASRPTSPPYNTKAVYHQEPVKRSTREDTQHQLELGDRVEKQTPRNYDTQDADLGLDVRGKYEHHAITHSGPPIGGATASQHSMRPEQLLKAPGPDPETRGEPWSSLSGGLDTLSEDSTFIPQDVCVPSNDNYSRPSVFTSAHDRQMSGEESDLSRNPQQPSRTLQGSSVAPFVIENANNQPARTPTIDFQQGDNVRLESATSTHSRLISILRNRSDTQTLRRVDRSLNGDLRAASKRGQAQANAAKTDQTNFALERRESYDPLKGSGRDRRQDMSDFRVLKEGWSDVRSSPRSSPSRPPSVRKRQSIVDFESKPDQVMAENWSLQEAKRQARGSSNPDTQTLTQALQARDLKLHEKDVEINSVKAHLQLLQDDVTRLSWHNKELTDANRNLSEGTNQRYATLQVEHDHAHHQWQQSSRQLDDLRQRHGQLTTGMEDVVHEEISTALEEKNVEIRNLRTALEKASEQIAVLQRQIVASKRDESFLTVRNEDYFDSACQKLCQHVQQWVLRFSKFSDNRVCRLLRQIHDEKIETRIDNAILDGSDADVLLSDRIRRRDVFMSIVMAIIWEYVFTRYLFGMDREQRQKLKALEKLLTEVGPLRAVAQWRATTLTLLSRRETFFEQRSQDTEAVVQEIYKTLAVLLPPPNNLVNQIQDSLRNVMKRAVDLSIEMRTQRAEYIMLPPLQPEYDSNGDLSRKVYFNASLMNERSGETTSNEELESRQSIVRLVLFPLVVKKGNHLGDSDEEVVVCPAQVLVAKPAKEKKVAGMMSTAMSIGDGNQSMQSAAPSTLDLNSVV